MDETENETVSACAGDSANQATNDDVMAGEDHGDQAINDSVRTDEDCEEKVGNESLSGGETGDAICLEEYETRSETDSQDDATEQVEPEEMIVQEAEGRD